MNFMFGIYNRHLAPKHTVLLSSLFITKLHMMEDLTDAKQLATLQKYVPPPRARRCALTGLTPFQVHAADRQARGRHRECGTDLRACERALPRLAHVSAA